MELGIILVLVLILFGAGRLPEVFSQFGKAVKGFKDAQRDDPLDVTRDSQKSIAEGVEDVEEARARDKAKRAS